jgi:hypothetical protein
MFTNAISVPVLKPFEKLSSAPKIASLYLRGGTALALQMGHRRSEDLDFLMSERLDSASVL